MAPTAYIIIRQPPASALRPTHTPGPQCLHVFHSLASCSARLETYIQQFREAQHTAEEYFHDESKGLKGYRLRDGVDGRSEGSIWIDSAGMEDRCEGERVDERRRMVGADRVIGRRVGGF
jgi:hypothetical protein